MSCGPNLKNDDECYVLDCIVTLNTQESGSLDISRGVGSLDGELALVALCHILDGQGVDVVLLHDLQVVAEGDWFTIVRPFQGWLGLACDDSLKLDGFANLADGGGQRFDDDWRSLDWLLDLGLGSDVENQGVGGLSLPVPCGHLVGSSILLLDVSDLDDAAVHVHVSLMLDGNALTLLKLDLVVVPLDIGFRDGNKPKS